MPARQPRTLRRFMCIWLIAVLISTAAAALFLAAFTNIGPYTWSSVVPALYRNQSTSRMSANEFLVQTPEGARHGRPLSEPDQPMKPGTVLGSLHWEVVNVSTGFPQEDTDVWTTLTITNIQPGASGPPASDIAAWTRIVHEAGCGNFGKPIPAALVPGGAPVTIHYPWNFLRNAAWRIAHAPTWFGPCIALGFALAAIDLRLSRSRRRRAAGLCVRCGYDRQGLPQSTPCPECGEVP